jgi:hypothetical protein
MPRYYKDLQNNIQQAWEKYITITGPLTGKYSEAQNTKLEG